MGVTEGFIYSATGGACTGHNDKTKLSGKMLLPSGHSGYTTVTFGGYSVVIPGIHRRPASRPCPQGARRASHRWSMCRKVQGHVHSMESLGFSAVGAGSKMLFWCPNLGFSDSSLVCTCSCIGEAAKCVSISAGLKAPFWGFLFKCCSTVHKWTDHPRRLLVSDVSPDFNKPLCLSIMPAAVDYMAHETSI